MKKTEIQECADRLLKSDKPKMIVGVLKTLEELTDEHIKHFDTSVYLWQVNPSESDNEYKGLYLGLLLNETLEYVQLLYVSEEVLDKVLK